MLSRKLPAIGRRGEIGKPAEGAATSAAAAGGGAKAGRNEKAAHGFQGRGGWMGWMGWMGRVNLLGTAKGYNYGSAELMGQLAGRAGGEAQRSARFAPENSAKASPARDPGSVTPTESGQQGEQFKWQKEFLFLRIRR